MKVNRVSPTQGQQGTRVQAKEMGGTLTIPLSTQGSKDQQGPQAVVVVLAENQAAILCQQGLAVVLAVVMVGPAHHVGMTVLVRHKKGEPCR